MVMINSNGHLALSLSQLIANRTADSPESIALTAPGQRPLTYGRLGLQLEKITRALSALGLGRHDCVAVALPPGPELAVAFLAVASQSICAPLPHACQVETAATDLKALQAKALIIPSGAELPAVAAAQSCGIPVLKLGSIRGVETGLFALTGMSRFNPVDLTVAEPDDVALVMRPGGLERKRVVFTHADLCARGYCMAADLGLGQEPLDLMSLPFIDRFIEGVVAAFAVGISVMCCMEGEASESYTQVAHTIPAWSEAGLSVVEDEWLVSALSG